MFSKIHPAAATAALVVAAFFSSAGARAETPLTATLISDVAERVMPAVVNVLTKKQGGPAPNLPYDHPMLRELFGPEGRRLPRSPSERGAGSGVIISADGYIITNNHVVEGADEIKVILIDKRELVAKLVGADKPSDIALLKIDATGLPFLTFGDSDTLRLGEIVLAIGNPFGIGQTVTMGIVSAKSRAPKIGTIDYEDFIQTDAAINPGNSGGALVNLEGKLVGVNTAIVSAVRASAGVGLAVPSNMVKPIRDQLVQFGRVKRGWMGVAIQDITPELARSLELSDARGVLISDVMSGGPAEKAKLQAGDIVTKVEDRPTNSASELRNMVALLRPGSKAKLSVIRDGKNLELTVTLSEKQDDGVEQPSEKPEEERLLSGMELQELDPQLRRRLGLPPKIHGVVVTDIAPDSPAESSGLEQGDVIVSVNRQPVTSVSDLTRLVGKRPSGEVLLRVYRQGVFTFIVLRR